MFIRKEDIPLDRERCAHREALLFFIFQIIVNVKALKSDIKAGATISQLFSIIKSEPDSIIVNSSFAMLIGFYVIFGHLSILKRKLLLKYGKQYPGKIIKISRSHKFWRTYFKVEYTDDEGKVRRYRNPGIETFLCEKILSDKCTVYRLGIFTYVHGFELYGSDYGFSNPDVREFQELMKKYTKRNTKEDRKKHKETMAEFERLTRELGSEDRALEEMKRRAMEKAEKLKEDYTQK